MRVLEASRHVERHNCTECFYIYMVRYARTGPALSTQHGLDIGWSTTCDREYTIVVHLSLIHI